MGKDSNDEIEQIQQGLENFLEREMDGYQTCDSRVSRQEDASRIQTDPWYPSAEEKPVSCDHTYRQRPSSHAREIKADMLPPENHREENHREVSGQEPVRQKRSRDMESGNKPNAEEAAPTPKKKRKKKKSFLKRFLICLLALCVLAGGLWYFLVGTFYEKMNYSEIESLAAQPMKEDGVINILLIGNDSRSQGEDGRSDAMILLSVSSKTGTIHMMSLLRDMYVDIPGHEGNRLNAAYAFGGPELLVETLEQNLDIEVNRYVQVNFQAFANLVDAVGGVDLELSIEEVQYVNGYLTEYNVLEGRPEGTDYLDPFSMGMLHLNGPQALAYCRIRYIGSDFGRTERQREVLSAIIKKAPKALLTNPLELLNGLLPNLTTNLTKSECMALSLQVFNLGRYEIVQSSIPVPGSYSNAKIRGMAVLDVDFEINKEFIRQNIYGE